MSTLPGWPRVIVHADMDAFFAAVEQLDDPRLRGRPVLVGARTGRGVVAAASYEARPFGIGSAMPMMQALRACPDACVVAPRFDRYREVSARIMAAFGQFTPSVEVLGLDEAFLDMTGTAHRLPTANAVGAALKAAVREATGGLRVSVGIATAKFVAKLASDHDKPDGLTIVPPGTEADWLAPQPVGRLWGAGPRTRARLEALGCRRIGDVAAADPAALGRALGRNGPRFHALARGDDPRPVEPRRPARSLGAERTLAADVGDRAELARLLRESADEVARRLRAAGLVAGAVGLRLKTTDFRLLTRQAALAGTTDAGEVLHAAACRLLGRVDEPGPFRLVGLVARALEGPATRGQLSLLDAPPRSRRLEGVLDVLDARFGRGTVRRARDLAPPGSAPRR